MEPSAPRHGGNLQQAAVQLGCRPSALLDLSASLVPFGPPTSVRQALLRAQWPGPTSPLCTYPDRAQTDLRQAIAAHHGLDPEAVLPGNGAAELFTWAARDAAALGCSLLPAPGFADYARALACWQAPSRPLPLRLGDWSAAPSPFTAALHDPEALGTGAVLWITNPHNPTGQLWSRASLEQLLTRFALVIVDEAFLPLVPAGEDQSLLPLLAHHPQLVVIRSLTKLGAIAGLRSGYALADPRRLARWAAWRDPWPVNGLAAAVVPALLADGRWSRRVQAWVAREGPLLRRNLDELPGLRSHPSAGNYLLLQADHSLLALQERLAHRHRILVRDCRGFAGLDARWWRLALPDRRGHRRLLAALRHELAPSPHHP
jgi:histidinol-phosphate/aromatic aminotransferase/cobyric acid decarboxylase-like protein